MDIFFQKAKVFAQETAKKSQEIAMEAAKISQEIAQETAKRSKEIAVEASKKADELKKLAEELPPSIASAASRMAGELSSSPGPASLPTEAELEEYGITPDLRDFVRGLTINTFKEFPLAEYEAKQQQEGSDTAGPTRQDLPEWQERHAVLVLKSVPEMSDFRYVLCPRRMKENRFWRIYFILVKNFVAPYEAQYIAAKKLVEEEEARNVESSAMPTEKGAETAAIPVRETSKAKEAQKTEASKPAKSRTADQDLDAYLLGPDSGDEGPDGDDDADFDDDFDRALDSDGDDETPKQGHPPIVAGKHHTVSTASKASEGSSDGELVEIPDNESPSKLESSGAVLQ